MRDIKQIYHSFFRGTSWIYGMGLRFLPLYYFLPRLCPSENSTVEGTSEPIDSTSASQEWYICLLVFSGLKPQDSFGKKDKTFSWSAESAAHRQKTPKNLCSTCLNDVFSCNNVKWLNISTCMYITYGRVFGGTPNILIFGLFLENESNLEWTMNRAFIVHTDLLKSCIDNKIIYLLIFRHIPKLSCGFKTFSKGLHYI